MGSGYQAIHDNTLGEFGVSLLLQSAGVLPMLAERAAAGWGGDRLRAFRQQKGKLLLAWRTVWDTPDDAAQFAEAFLIALEKRWGTEPERRSVKLGTAVATEASLRLAESARAVRLRAVGRSVDLLDGPGDLVDSREVQQRMGW